MSVRTERAALTSGNLLTNPGFESGSLSGWTVGGSSTPGVATDGTVLSSFFGPATVEVRTGTYAAHNLTAAEAGIGTTLTQTVPVDPSTTYNIGFLEVSSLLAVNLFPLQILVDSTLLGLSFSPHIGVGSLPTDFKRVSATYTTGPSQTSATVTFRLFASGTGRARMSYDDFFFQRDPPPGPAFPTGTFPTSLVNKGFETGDFSGWLVVSNTRQGVATDGTVLPSDFGPTSVEVRSGTYAAHNLTAAVAVPPIGTTLIQTLSVTPRVQYTFGFHHVTSLTSVGPSFGIVVNGIPIPLTRGGGDGFGTDPSDFAKLKGSYVPGPGEGAVNVSFRLFASGSGRARMSYDDFFMSSGASIEEVVHNAQELIAAIPPSAFKRPKNARALNKKLQDVIDAVNAALADPATQDAALQDVLDRLNSDILTKTDGCHNGGAPDANDWVKTCAEQGEPYDAIVAVIDFVSALIGFAPPPCETADFPQCNGFCSSGSFCFPQDGSCRCYPAGSTPCNFGPFPTCGGDCLDGRVCQAARGFDGGILLGEGCTCVDPTLTCGVPPETCPAFGVCPPGEVCGADFGFSTCGCS